VPGIEGVIYRRSWNSNQLRRTPTPLPIQPAEPSLTVGLLPRRTAPQGTIIPGSESPLWTRPQNVLKICPALLDTNRMIPTNIRANPDSLDHLKSRR